MQKMNGRKTENEFVSWIEEMSAKFGKPLTFDKARKMLGKSPRMVAYYAAGRKIPSDTLILMDAYLKGYRPLQAKE